MASRVGLYGGSFNPIHHGHLIVARAVAERLVLERVIFLPSGHPPHKQPASLLDARHRAKMVRLAIAGEPLFEYSDHDLDKDGPTYTVHTLAHFADRFGPDTELFWIIGADSLGELASWYRISTLVDRCGIVTAARPGADTSGLDALRGVLSGEQIQRLAALVLETPRIDISATDIRARIRAGRSVRYLVPETVCTYIEDNGLYQ